MKALNSKSSCQLWSYQQWRCCRLIHSQYCMQSKSDLVKYEPRKDIDIIGPPDEISNLRPVIFAKSERETQLEKKYREVRENTQNWNQEFWLEHNSRFITERKQFQKGFERTGNGSITADQMSVFYKSFLDKNWKNHLNYNILWYKKNLHILILELRVRLSKFKFK